MENELNKIIDGKPLVSVIITYKNASATIYRTIQSLIFQNYDNWQAVLVNCGSTDSSSDIIRAFKGELDLPGKEYYEKIKMTAAKEANRSKAWENGVQQADGEWIIFCEEDGKLRSYGIRSLLMQADGADLVIGNYQKVSETGKELQLVSHDFLRIEKENIISDILSRKREATVYGKLIAKSLAEKLAFPDRDIQYGDEWLLTMDMLFRCRQIASSYDTNYLQTVHKKQKDPGKRHLSILPFVKAVQAYSWSEEGNFRERALQEACRAYCLYLRKGGPWIPELASCWKGCRLPLTSRLALFVYGKMNRNGQDT